MDFDGLLLLMDRDLEKFKDWNDKMGDLSLEELKKGLDDWLTHYRKMYAEYKDLKTGVPLKDASLHGAKMMYFHFLASYTLNAFTLYTKKLQFEYEILKKAQRKTTVKTKKPHSSIPNRSRI